MKRMNVMRLVSMATVLVVGAPVATLAAQAGPVQSVNVPVTSRVFMALTVTTTDNLRFGSIYAPSTTPKVVDFTDNAASGGRARVTIAGEGGAALDVGITVPTSLSNGSGGNLAVGSFALRWNTTDADGTGTDVNLTSGANALSLTMPGAAGTSQNLYLRIRGTATPISSQPAGAYAGNITVNVNYTGA